MSRFAILIFATLPLGAQWVHLPTPGIPRTADGKPSLTAPAPRTAEGKPDLSGLWGKASDKYYNNIAADQEPGVVQAWAEALYQQRRKDFGKDSMEALCLPFGPTYTTTPYRESRIIQTPAMLAILNDDLTHRVIFMDGRQLEKEPNPSWMGYSVDIGTATRWSWKATDTTRRPGSTAPAVLTRRACGLRNDTGAPTLATLNCK
jgi:hypothetical protein